MGVVLSFQSLLYEWVSVELKAVTTLAGNILIIKFKEVSFMLVCSMTVLLLIPGLYYSITVLLCHYCIRVLFLIVGGHTVLVYYSITVLL